ncbi:MAG: hypothetical protein JXA43_01470 [Candidatus Diapherotrites archaeon]|nr:hypothetical protein [Candidatus Diapherotrites archaeon]
MFAWENYPTEVKEQAKQLLKESTIALSEVKEILALVEKGEDPVTGEKLSRLDAANMRIACIATFVDSANDLAAKFEEIGYENGAKLRTELSFRRQEWVMSEFFKEGMKDFARELIINPDNPELEAEVKAFAINLSNELASIREPVGRIPPGPDAFQWELDWTMFDAIKEMKKYLVNS